MLPDYKPGYEREIPPRWISPQIQNLFNIFYKKWKEETFLIASPKKCHENKWYQAIIGLGPVYECPPIPCHTNGGIVTILIMEMDNNPDDWHTALVEITGENPVLETARGNLKLVAEAWIEWGKKNGYYLYQG